MKKVVYNITLGVNSLLVFLTLLDKSLAIPSWLQVVGRMHPLLLHFPIVLLVLVAVFEFMKSAKNQTPKSTLQNSEIGDFLMLSAAFTAAISALMGLFLSQEEGYHAEAIVWHKWTGVVVSLVAFGWFTFKNTFRASALLSRLVSGVSLAAIVLAGHQGANITHGEDFLTAPLQAKHEANKASLEEAVVFTHLVTPILQKKCINCHNSQKAKGELLMETPAQLLKGGKHGKLWNADTADLGLLIQRILLPMDAKEHMPPAGKPQLTSEEKEILRYWIKTGANFKQKVSELAQSDPLKILAGSILKTSDVETYTFKAANEGTIKKLNTNYRVIAPLALGSPALSVDFFSASQFDHTQLKALQAIKKQIVQLNLNRMPIKDEDLKTIASFENLRKLNLSFTPITGATLNELKTLKFLRVLSLSGTKVNRSDLAALKTLPALRDLKLWNTGVTKKDLMALKLALPKTAIEMGFDGDTVVAQLSMPILINDDIQVFQKDTRIQLKHYVNGAVIRYTLDGTAPDSLTSRVYTEEGILIDKTAMLNAKVYLDGWISSDTLTQQFYRAGFIADSIRLAQPPNPQYSGKSKMLLDGKLGGKNFKSGKWLGFKETFFEGYAYFSQPIRVSKVTFSTLIDIGSYIMPPKEIQVWGGNSAKDLVLLKTIIPQQPNKITPMSLQGFECSFHPKQVKILKLVGKSVQKLPDWHPGKGDKGWFFVDEVLIN